MLNPENRPLLGIYSDEGVGFEHGGPRGFGMLAMSNEQQQRQPMNDNPQQQSTTTTQVPKKRSYVSSNPFGSMEEQRNELEHRMTPAIAPITTAPAENPTMDPAHGQQEYYKRRIEASRKRANQS